MVTTKQREDIREYVWQRLTHDPHKNYRAEVRAALEEHLNEAEKEGDCTRMEMYHAALIALERMPG